MNQSSALKQPAAFLVTAAGSGKRMGGGAKKEFREIDGIPVLVRVVKTMLETSLFSFGLITCTPGLQQKTKEVLTPLKKLTDNLSMPLFFCDGGSERQESVYHGLLHLADHVPGLSESGIVLIHDGARPWVRRELVRKIYAGTVKYGACAPVVPSTDAMKQISDEGTITAHLPRKETVAVQTPQGFSFRQILEAHGKASDDGLHFIDDTEIYNRYIGGVMTIPGDRNNAKITYPEDL